MTSGIATSRPAQARGWVGSPTFWPLAGRYLGNPCPHGRMHRAGLCRGSPEREAW